MTAREDLSEKDAPPSREEGLVLGKLSLSPVLDVRHFGIGYWIGGLGSTLLYLSVLYFTEKNLYGLTVLLLQFIFLPTMCTGTLLSVLQWCKGRQSRDRNVLIGGISGTLLSGWLFVYIFLVLTLSPYSRNNQDRDIRLLSIFCGGRDYAGRQR